MYVQTPSLLAYVDGNLDKRISRGCEILRKKPHANIMAYYSYIESHGQVSGLYFKRYTSTLLRGFNPQYLVKATFLSSRRELVTESMTAGL